MRVRIILADSVSAKVERRLWHAAFLDLLRVTAASLQMRYGLLIIEPWFCDL
jgi:hypothetical protein